MADWKPNTFIVGAPKCGTTALYEYLQQHPDVFFCPLKEPHYFSTDIQSEIPEHLKLDGRTASVETEQEYQEAFAGGENYAVRGEASVRYLFSKAAPEAIKKFNSTAKLLFCFASQ